MAGIAENFFQKFDIVLTEALSLLHFFFERKRPREPLLVKSLHQRQYDASILRRLCHALLLW
jgi:hypothetical protein